MTEPRHIAAAIADLGHDVLTRAWCYLLDTHALVRARVPGAIMRAGLMVQPDSRLHERSPEIDTDALGIVREWSERGSSGVLIGPVGCGKSHAAVQWLLEWARAGHSIKWTQAGRWRPTKGHEPEIEACQAAHALVIDDLGAGSVSAWTLEELNGLVCGRLDRSLPTVIVSNLDRFALKDGTYPLLDERSTSRLMGRVRFVSGANLRTVDEDEPASQLDREGRGRAWQRARGTIEIFGVELDGVPAIVPVELWHRADRGGRVVFGSLLSIRLATSVRSQGPDAARAEARDACRRVGVDPSRVRERAEQVAATEGLEARKCVDSALARFADGVAAAKLARHEASERLAKRSSDDELEARRAALAKLPHVPPTHAQLDPPRLRALGYAVERRGDGWAVIYQAKSAEGVKRKPSARVLVDGAVSEDEAWRAAMAIQRGE